MGDGRPAIPQKRAAAGGDASQQKRNKVNAARTIPAQPAESALKDGELDLQAFVQAHEFEIRSLEQSMATSKAVSSSRAFQQVPRGLRRRTASHNPKRVPKRLRPRARKEMAEDNTPTVEARRRKPKTTRARIRAETAKKLGILAKRKATKNRRKAEEKRLAAKDGAIEETEKKSGDAAVLGRKPRPKIRRDVLNEPPQPPARVKKRQINKTWLPTHTWHAKRARMTEPKSPLWGFSIPLTPNEKIYRPTHRAQGNRGAMFWDASYFSTIGILGNTAGLERVLRRLGISRETNWNEKGRKWRAGTKSWQGMLSREAKNGRKDVAIAAVIWNPKSQDAPEAQEPKKSERQVYVRVHPSAFAELFAELVRLTKMEKPRLHVEDLRYEIGSIELTGPASTEVLHAILTPYETASAKNASHAKLFQRIRGVTNAASLPVNSILGFSVQDPRLREPRRDKDEQVDASQDEDILETLVKWPSDEGLGPYAIFDRNSRYTASNLPTQRRINRRKGAIPAWTQLKPTQEDPRIPILLLASRSLLGTQAQGNWTLLAPWSCIQHFWHSIVLCPLSTGGNPRFGGVNEMRQVAFERGQPWFPGDFIATKAGAEWELAERRQRKKAYDKRPKSKRPAWASIELGAGRKGEIGDGLACDWERLFGTTEEAIDTKIVADETSTDPDAMDIDHAEDNARTQSKQAESSPLDALRAITKKDLHSIVWRPNSKPLQHKVLMARIKFKGTGVAKPRARIYRLPTTSQPKATAADAEVPATIPPVNTVRAGSRSIALPLNLRARWLARAAAVPRFTNQDFPLQSPATPTVNKATDLDTRKRLLAQELTAPYTGGSEKKDPCVLDADGKHLVVPDEQDLIGFVTTGSFCLSQGHGFAIGSLSVEKVVPGLKSEKEGHMCIVRNAGESVGWLARWEPI